MKLGFRGLVKPVYSCTLRKIFLCMNSILDVCRAALLVPLPDLDFRQEIRGSDADSWGGKGLLLAPSPPIRETGVSRPREAKMHGSALVLRMHQLWSCQSYLTIRFSEGRNLKPWTASWGSLGYLQQHGVSVPGRILIEVLEALEEFGKIAPVGEVGEGIGKVNLFCDSVFLIEAR